MDQGVFNKQFPLEAYGITDYKSAYWNCSPEELVEMTISRGQGELADSGALSVNTGEFRGRSPKDKYIVRDAYTENVIDWGGFNNPVAPEVFDGLYQKVVAYFKGKEIWARDCSACASESYRMNIRVITETPWANLFAYNMFLKPESNEVVSMIPDWTVIQAPGFLADPKVDGVGNHNFAILNFTKRIALIGGTAYTGEIKKGIFTVLNCVLPHEHGVLPMHCSANVGKGGDTAIFFGLSGTGKTTLSTDSERPLIGDDEHGWADGSVFNFEGGCYAKCIDLSAEKEPEIYQAIRKGSILENIEFYPGTKSVDFASKKFTENTRVSYPIQYIDNALKCGYGPEPKTIFFLTYDAFGVLPPISKLTEAQAMYYFLSGFTSKVAGTEKGVKDPQTTFSTCFGAPFLPLHPTVYANMLGDKLKRGGIQVWLLNTGYHGGPFGVGKRISLPHTRSIIRAIMQGEMNDVTFNEHVVFGLKYPTSCPGVPSDILDPKNTWTDKEHYDAKALQLAQAFQENFKKFEGRATPEIIAASPRTESVHI